ncbi:MAG: cupin domain-containing protein [Anaerohalosphaeraceae bacterium]|nr:cupin domain-containing protein [Anaerohalosphaeraceae bacterium]
MAEQKKNMVLDAVMAKAANLADMVDYSDDSVVSKTIIDKSVGTITLFVFDAGQGLSQHQAPYDAVVQIVDGDAVLVIDGKDVAATAGQIVVMPANVPHSVRADSKFKMLLTMIRA